MNLIPIKTSINTYRSEYLSIPVTFNWLLEATRRAAELRCKTKFNLQLSTLISSDTCTRRGLFPVYIFTVHPLNQLLLPDRNPFYPSAVCRGRTALQTLPAFPFLFLDIRRWNPRVPLRQRRRSRGSCPLNTTTSARTMTMPIKTTPSPS